MINPPSPEITQALANERPGRALDIACGTGRHASWLALRGWEVSATDLIPTLIRGVHFHVRDIEKDGLEIEPASWDLIVCWLYWQADLLPAIAAGIRGQGIVALCGRTSGRFATSLANYRAAFPGWAEIDAGEDDHRAWFIARRSTKD